MLLFARVDYVQAITLPLGRFATGIKLPNHHTLELDRLPSGNKTDPLTLLFVT